VPGKQTRASRFPLSTAFRSFDPPGGRGRRRLAPTRPSRALTGAPITGDWHAVGADRSADYRRLTSSERWPERRLPPTIADCAAPAVDRSADHRRLPPITADRAAPGSEPSAD